MAELPTGTVTFLFTDLEGSTRVWEEHRDAMAAAVERHDALLEGAIVRHGGVVFSRGGDGMAAAFGTAQSAVAAAVDAQLALSCEVWGDDTGALRARMGVHTGEGRIVGEQEDQYESHTLNRCARLMAVAHGEQLVISGTTAALVRGELPAGCDLFDMGEHRLRDLQSTMHVFQVAAPGLRSSFPPLRSLDAVPGNLPRQVTTFVGRETEIASLADLVCRSSLVTLTGVGGVGKTRLALQVAAEVVTDFPDGAWMCEFAPVADPGVVWETLAASLRVQAFPDRSLEESVVEYLAAKRLLLVLDNCEHLLDAIARQVAAIAQRCPRVSVLATSREGLALGGERIVAVPSLSVPTDDSDVGALIAADAVQLFADRANAARNDFALTDRNATAVGVLCRRLDGIPLAIELAAARVRSMSVEDLVGRLDQRFKLLTRGSRAALERHQTLRSTIDWSYDLLDPTERHALDCLSVFAGSCDLAAAEAVLATDELAVVDVVDVLGQLVDKSLVVAADHDAGRGVRYRLFESIRQYAGERLEASGETAAVRRRHADHYVAVAESAGPHLRSRDQIEWAQRMLRDTDNFRAVLDWSVETPSPDHGLRLVVPLRVIGLAIGDAAQEWAETAITIPGADEHALFCDVAVWAAVAAALANNLERAEALVVRAAATQTALDTSNLSVVRVRGILALFRGETEEAQTCARAWVDLAREHDDPYELTSALLLLASAQFEHDDATIATLEEAVHVARDAGIASALATALPFLGGMLPLDESDRALALLDEAIEVGRRAGDRQAVALTIGSKCVLAFRRGEWPAALRAAHDTAAQMLELGGLVTIKDFFRAGGAALSALGHDDAAAVLIGKADAMSAGGMVGSDWWLEPVAATGATLVARLGKQQFAILAAQGAALENAEAVAYLRAQADAVPREN